MAWPMTPATTLKPDKSDKDICVRYLTDKMPGLGKIVRTGLGWKPTPANIDHLRKSSMSHGSTVIPSSKILPLYYRMMLRKSCEQPNEATSSPIFRRTLNKHLKKLTATILPLLVVIFTITCPATLDASLLSFLEKAAVKSAGKAAQSTRKIVPIFKSKISSIDRRAALPAAIAGAAAIDFASGNYFLLKIYEDAVQLYSGSGKLIKKLDSNNLPDELSSTLSSDVNLYTSSDGRPLLIADVDLFSRHEKQLEMLSDRVSLHVEVDQFGLRPVHRIRVGEQNKLLVELKQDILLPIEDLPFAAEIDWLLRQTVRREDIRVVSLFAPDETDTLQRLRLAAGDRLIEFSEFPPAPETIRSAIGGRLAVFVGHVEGSAYVIRNASGEKIGLWSLDKVAETSTSIQGMPLLIGCHSYASCALPSGMTSPVRDIKIAESIERISQARSYEDMLTALGGTGSQFVISRDLLQAEVTQIRLNIRRLEAGSQVVEPATFVTRLYARALERPEFLEVVGGGPLLVMGATSLLLSYTCWPFFIRTFPDLPNPKLGLLRYSALWMARVSVFVLFSPVVAWAFLTFLLMGAWKNRGETYEAIWSFICIPIQYTSTILPHINLFIRTVGGAALVASYCLGAAAAISAFSIWLSEAILLSPMVFILNDYDSALFDKLSDMYSVAVASSSVVLIMWSLCTGCMVFAATKAGLIPEQ